MNLPRLAVLRPISTAMLLISILVLGAIAFSRLPLAFLPEIDAAIAEGLVTLEKVEVRFYRSGGGA